MDTRTEPRAPSGRAPDPRSQATVAALKRALRELLADHSLDELTVSSVCAHAGVSRTSLYTHFPSVPDLLATMLVDNVEDWMGDPSGRDPASADYASVMRASLRRTLRRIDADRLLFARAFQASDRASSASDSSMRFARSLSGSSVSSSPATPSTRSPPTSSSPMRPTAPSE